MAVRGLLCTLIFPTIASVVGACGGSDRVAPGGPDGASDATNSGDAMMADEAAPETTIDASISDVAMPETAGEVAAPVPALGNVTAISVGAGFTCALLSDGTVQCWGANGAGQLGNSTTNSDTPVAVSGLSGVIAISAGTDFACALLSGGSVQCWGEITYGEFDGSTGCAGSPCSRTPVAISGLGVVTAIAAGDSFACALLSHGPVQCWGANTSGQLGDPEATTPSPPVVVPGLSHVTAIAAGKYSGSACALLSGGTVECWGDNKYGQLGDGTSTGPQSCSSFPCSTTPVAVMGLSGATAISVGDGFACALLSGGTVQCWGLNVDGALGNGTTTGPQTCFSSNPCSLTPVAVSGLSGATAIAAGSGCALLPGGTVECWGDNSYGQLGNGTTTNSSIPVAVSGLSGVTAISASAAFACALLSAGTVDCWGINLGTGSSTNSSTPVAVMQ
jgi:alpha-tubulin suppressor-like RCC1 family protein